MKYCPFANGPCRNDCMMRCDAEECALRKLAAQLPSALGKEMQRLEGKQKAKTASKA